MTKKDVPNELVWTEAKNRAFETLKKHISKPPILKFCIEYCICVINKQLGIIFSRASRTQRVAT